MSTMFDLFHNEPAVQMKIEQEKEGEGGERGRGEDELEYFKGRERNGGRRE